MAAETINNTTNVTLTAEDGGCQGHTFTGTAQTAMIYVESGAHDVTFSALNITTKAEVGIVPSATMNPTIEGTNTIQSSKSGAVRTASLFQSHSTDVVNDIGRITGPFQRLRHSV